jgi:hypothetical protein
MTHTVKAWTAIVAGAAGLAMATPSVARAGDEVVATVPFEFTVGNVQFPAGGYVISHASDEDAAIVAITSTGSRYRAIALTIPSAADNEAPPELVFERIDGRNYLARVVMQPGDERELLVQHPMADRAARNADALVHVAAH